MTEQPHRPFPFWILWVLLSGVGGAVGIALAVASFFVLGYGAMFSLGIPNAIVLFLSIGMAQSLVLRTRVPRLTWWTWPVTTAVFGIMGVLVGIVTFFLAFLAADSMTWANGSGYFGIGNATLICLMLAGMVGGAVIGFGQAIALSDYLERSGLLIPVNAFAWALGLVFGVFLTLSPPGVSWVVTRGASHSIDLPRLIILGAVSIALISAIQGAALAWMMHKTNLEGKVLTLAESEQPARLAEQE
jgi:hypothetical protein